MYTCYRRYRLCKLPKNFKINGGIIILRKVSNFKFINLRHRCVFNSSTLSGHVVLTTRLAIVNDVAVLVSNNQNPTTPYITYNHMYLMHNTGNGFILSHFASLDSSNWANAITRNFTFPNTLGMRYMSEPYFLSYDTMNTYYKESTVLPQNIFRNAFGTNDNAIFQMSTYFYSQIWLNSINSSFLMPNSIKTFNFLNGRCVNNNQRVFISHINLPYGYTGLLAYHFLWRYS